MKIPKYKAFRPSALSSTNEAPGIPSSIASTNTSSCSTQNWPPAPRANQAGERQSQQQRRKYDEPSHFTFSEHNTDST